ncbi:MAG TPA: sugar phosphate isomerase/epimerase [Mycobacterium sp.]
MNELGCSTLCFARMPRVEAFDHVASMGFGLVDLGMLRRFNVGEGPFCAHHLDALTADADEIRLVRDELDERALQLVAVNAGGGYLNLAWERDEAIAYVRRSIEICRDLGGRVVTIQSGKLLRGTDWRANAEYVAPAVRELASQAEQAGLELHVEGPHLEMLTHDLRTTLDFLDMVEHDNVFVTMDPSHIVVADEDPIEVTRALAPLIRHVHIRDGAGNSPVVVPGLGEIDFPAFVRVLREHDYTGPMMIELCQDEAEDYETSNARYLADTRFALEFMRKVLARVDPSVAA